MSHNFCVFDAVILFLFCVKSPPLHNKKANIVSSVKSVGEAGERTQEIADQATQLPKNVSKQIIKILIYKHVKDKKQYTSTWMYQE